MAQCAVTLANAPMVMGSIPALRARGFWVPPCSSLVFRSLHCGFSQSSLCSETLVSDLHCISVAFTVLRAVQAKNTVRSYRHRSLPYRLSLVGEIKIHSFVHSFVVIRITKVNEIVVLNDSSRLPSIVQFQN